VLGEARFQEAKARYLASLKPAPKGKPAKSAAAASSASVAVPAETIDAMRNTLAAKLHRAPTDDEFYSHLMYPQVFADFQKHQREFGDVSVLPTAAFFYGLQAGEEISVEIEEGKVLIIRLVSVGAPDKDGRRNLGYELNGIARDVLVADRGVVSKTKARPKADLADPAQIAAPIPGLVAALSTSVGAKVAKGDKLLMMEAMKMQTTVYATCNGVVGELHVAVGDTVESKDLLLHIRSV
jgi:pyruvate carboxylase